MVCKKNKNTKIQKKNIMNNSLRDNKDLEEFIKDNNSSEKI